MRFRTALILTLVSILLGTVAIVGVMSYRNSEFAVRELSAQVLEQTSQRVDQRVDAVLGVAVAQSRVYEELLTSGTLDVNDFEGMTRHFLGSIRANPQLSYISFGTEEYGEYWHAFRRADGALEIRTFLRKDDDRMELTDSAPQPDGTLTTLRHDLDSDRADPRGRPYYIRAREVGEATWTETYVFLGMETMPTIPGVTRATPIYRDGELAGVLTADFDLHALSKFVAGLPVGKSGFAFIVELRRPTEERPDGEQRVIAHPDPDLLVAPDPDDPKSIVAVPGNELDDPRVRAFLAKLPADVRDAPTETFQPVDLDVDGEHYIGGYRRVGEEGLAWIICMMMPEDDVMGSVYANTRTTVYIVVLGILVAIVVSFLLSAAIGRTLRELAAESQAIGAFELEGREPTPSRLLEIRQLGTALEEMKASLRSFKKFVPADIVRALLASGEEATRGGERREISIFFCDIAGFTSIAETMPADELSELLSEFLGAMSTQIMASGGTVDKYIGDAIMAFWGAPQEVDDPAMVACTTALACQRVLAELNTAWKGRAWPVIEMRVGLHVGEAVVGNFGSDDRLDYTAIGDSVNLSSRIEGLNKYYGTHIAISEQTYAAVRDRVVARPIDRVSVKGRASGVVIYELLGLRDEVSAKVRARAARHAEAMEAYFAGDWDAAERIFEELVDASSHDVAARVLLERVRTLAADPPASWDGVHRMTSK